jgi:hypothetical protein
MKLRPHHLIDIVRDYGHGVPLAPHPYGHAVHTVAGRVLHDLDLEVTFVLAADDICVPCRHLRADGQCEDVLDQLDPPVSKQVYNDDLDARVFAALEMQPGVCMTVRAFLERLRAHVPGIEAICTHPGEDRAYRLDGLQKGLARLGAGASL